MIQQPDAVGFLRLHNARREQQLLSLRPTDLIHQCPGGVDASVGRRQEAEPRRIGTDADVQRGRQHGAAPVGQPVNHPDYRFVRRANLVAAR